MVGLTLSDFVLVRRTLHVGVMELHFIPTLTLVSRVSDSPRHWHHIPRVMCMYVVPVGRSSHHGSACAKGLVSHNRFGTCSLSGDSDPQTVSDLPSAHLTQTISTPAMQSRQCSLVSSRSFEADSLNTPKLCVSCRVCVTLWPLGQRPTCSGQ